MEIVAVIATVILLATLLTLIFSFAAYFVTRAKKILASRTKPATIEKSESVTTRIYFERYLPGGMVEERPESARGRQEDQWS